MANIANIMAAIASAACCGMLIINLADVGLRLLFTRVIPGATEIAQIFLLCMVASFPKVILNDSNTMVDVFVAKLPIGFRRVLNAVTVFATSIFCVLVGWQMFLSGAYAHSFNMTYTLSRIPQWLIYMIFGFSMIFSAFACITTIHREWNKVT